MNKLTVSMALAAMALVAQAQDMDARTQPDLAATAEVARFVNHPYNCRQMLGGGDDGDLLPTSYSVALDASLREINAPVDQALARIHALCAQRVSDLNRLSLK